MTPSKKSGLIIHQMKIIFGMKMNIKKHKNYLKKSQMRLFFCFILQRK
jgi:hypothetical protein